MDNFSKKQKIILGIVGIIVVGIIGYYVYGKDRGYEELNDTGEIMIKENETKTEENQDEEKIVVHITGAVKKEGIVELNENGRIADAVEKAGGLTDDADMSKINLAYVLEDGVKIKIPSKNDKEVDIEEKETTNYVEDVENYEDTNNRKWKG